MTVARLGGVLLLLAVFAGPSMAGPAQATSRTTPIRAVLELFTSQGCSSCPPADALLKAYAERPDVLALSLPVDYWDYIGWKDTFASPRHTGRQRAYTASIGPGQMYTPQVVVNGAAEANGTSQADIDAAIASTDLALASRRVPVEIRSEDGVLVVETGAAQPGAEVGHSTIWLVTLRKQATVAVKRGENAGRSLTYTNVVEDMTPVGLWEGSPARVVVAASATLQPAVEDIAVLVQEGDTGAILGAAWLDQ